MNLEWVDELRVKIRRPAWLDRLYIAGRRRAAPQGQIAESRSGAGKKLLVDMSVISRHDAGTGIQRVARAILNQILLEPLPGYTVLVVTASGKLPYRYIDWAGFSSGDLNNREVEVKTGDVFLGLDFSTHAIYRHRGQLARWKKTGATLAFFIHDLLPEKHPEWFSPWSVIRYRRWIREIVALADIVFCNSKATENEFLSFVSNRFRLSNDEIETCVLPMGSDIEQARWNDTKPRPFEQLPARLFVGQQIILMVGTIEPRKGHDQCLQAFEQLWDAGFQQILLLIGRPGWKTGKLQDSIRNSPYFGKLLFWFDDASDGFLVKAYRGCNGVLATSYGEGFGLPLLEAAMFRKPILARRLRVFEEQRLSGVMYFEADSVLQLVDALKAWFQYVREQPVCSNPVEKCSNWSKAREDIYKKLASFASRQHIRRRFLTSC